MLALSIDGGGVRGVFAAAVLARISATIDFIPQVHAWAGTSTGSIIAAAMCRGISAADVEVFYRQMAKSVFRDSWWDNVYDLGRMVGAQYDMRRLERHLTQILGNVTLDSLQARLMIPTFNLWRPDLQGWAAKFWHNWPGPGSDASADLVDVVCRSCAAPTYFPTVSNHIDGGVACNNPSMSLVAQCLEGGATLSDLHLLSIGTGMDLGGLEPRRRDWGIVQWAPHLTRLMLDGAVDLANYQCRQLLGTRYCRLDVTLPSRTRWAMDDVTRIPELISMANSLDLQPAYTWLANALHT
jgi:patatin-like phospholipase/acyl hydrolase